MPTSPAPTLFTYTISDGNGGTDTATVTVTVTPANDAPVANNDTATVAEDGSTSISVLANDSDVDGDTLSVTSASNPANGSVVINPDGTIGYTPDADFTGTDTFTYTISDGNGGTDTATVTVTVTPANDAPVAQDDVIVVAENTNATGSVAANDGDPDGDPLTFSLQNGPSMGVLIFNADGSYTYTPNTDYTGVDTFSYIVTDPRGATSVATASITVMRQGGPDIETLLTMNRTTGEDGSPGDVGPAAPQIEADGIIRDTVNGFSRLNAAAGIGADGIVVDTANNLSSLAGTADAGNAAQGKLTALSDERLREFIQNLEEIGIADLPDWQPTDAIGFSLQQSFIQEITHESSNRNDRIVIETLIRDERLFVQVTSSGDEGSLDIQDYRFTQADGRALPGWLKAASDGLLIGHRPADATEIAIRVSVVFEDGSVQSTTISIQAQSGEIQLIDKIAQLQDAAPTFAQQIADQVDSEDYEVAALARALGAD